MTLYEFKRAYVLETYAACGFNKKITAKVLGVTEKTIYNLLNSYNEEIRPMNNPEGFLFTTGQFVSKFVGDYDFEGVVISTFKKLSGQHRYIVENEHGSVHIFSASQLRPMQPDEIEAWKVKRAAYDAKKNLHSTY